MKNKINPARTRTRTDAAENSVQLALLHQQSNRTLSGIASANSNGVKSNLNLAKQNAVGSSLPKLIIIVGPTASGKSDLAIRLAKRFDGEIISADSRQVYRGLDLGTGKVPRSRLNPKSQITNHKQKLSYIKNLYISGEIVHHLIDVASPKRQFTVAQYKKRAQKALDDIYRRGKLPIICGGTGQYIDTLAYDLPIPNVKPNPALRKKLTNKTTRELFLMLKNLDVRRARTIDSHNPRRLIRALEIVLTTGKPVPTLRHPGLDPGSDSFRHEGRNDKVLWLGLNPPREKLYHNIHKRLLARMRRGMVAEVQKLKKNGISSRRLQALGLEYRYINRYLEGRLSKQEMLEQLEREIRKYAKRQMTWFKRNQQMHWLKQKEKAHTLVRAFLAFD